MLLLKIINWISNIASKKYSGETRKYGGNTRERN